MGVESSASNEASVIAVRGEDTGIGCLEQDDHVGDEQRKESQKHRWSYPVETQRRGDGSRVVNADQESRKELPLRDTEAEPIGGQMGAHFRLESFDGL